MPEKSNLLIIIRIAHNSLDQIMPSVRRLLFTFKWLTRFFEATSQLIWSISNEYSKRCIGPHGKWVRIYDRLNVIAPQNSCLVYHVHITDNVFC